MRFEHEEFERIYVRKMNRIIKGLPEYEAGMEVVSLGGGIEVVLNGTSVANPSVSGMLGVAHKAANEEIQSELRDLAKRLNSNWRESY